MVQTFSTGKNLYRKISCAYFWVLATDPKNYLISLLLLEDFYNTLSSLLIYRPPFDTLIQDFNCFRVKYSRLLLREISNFDPSSNFARAFWESFCRNSWVSRSLALIPSKRFEDFCSGISLRFKFSLSFCSNPKEPRLSQNVPWACVDPDPSLVLPLVESIICPNGSLLNTSEHPRPSFAV
jgi:hypothetical protein